MKQEINQFIASPGKNANKVVIAETTLKMHDEYSNVSMENEWLKGTFSLLVKDDTKPAQVSLKSIAYALEKLFKKWNDYKNT